MSQVDCKVGLVGKQVNAVDVAGKIDLPADADGEVADVDLKRPQNFEVRTSLVWMM